MTNPGLEATHDALSEDERAQAWEQEFAFWRATEGDAWAEKWAEGCRLGAQEVIEEQLEAKFGPLPGALRARLQSASYAELLGASWGVLLATSLDEFMGSGEWLPAGEQVEGELGTDDDSPWEDMSWPELSPEEREQEERERARLGWELTIREARAEGWADGWARGWALGFAKGLRERTAEEARRLERLVTLKFGLVPEHVQDYLWNCTEDERDQVAERLFVATRLDDLLPRVEGRALQPAARVRGPRIRDPQLRTSLASSASKT